MDFVFTITEGKQFQLRRLEFVGNTFTRDYVLRREVLVNEGDVYNQRAWEVSILRLNQLGFFNPIDKDKDADFRTDEEQAQVDITLKVSERGRQQISFNGGISGIGRSEPRSGAGWSVTRTTPAVTSQRISASASSGGIRSKAVSSA